MNLVKGSIENIAKNNNTSIAETFMNIDAIILIDVSISMADKDTDSNQSRYDVALDELSKLQNNLPGKVAVISFSSFPSFCPNGIPNFDRGMTDMAKALKHIKIADGCGIKFILISDGEPNSKGDTLSIAKTFETKIDTIFIGKETSSGRDFLQKLSDLTGGISVTQETEKLHFLETNLQLLLNA